MYGNYISVGYFLAGASIIGAVFAGVSLDIYGKQQNWRDVNGHRRASARTPFSREIEMRAHAMQAPYFPDVAYPGARDPFGRKWMMYRYGRCLYK